MSENDPLEPFPGYRYTPVSAARADALQIAAREAMLALAPGSLFDTEPELIAKTLAALAKEGQS